MINIPGQLKQYVRYIRYANNPSRIRFIKDWGRIGAQALLQLQMLGVIQINSENRICLTD